MAIASRRRVGRRTHRAVHHSDHKSQYLSIRYSTRLDDNHIVASAGSVRDNYDNAITESFNGLHKSELTYPHRPSQDLREVEFATPEHVDSYNHRRSHNQLPARRYNCPPHTKTPTTIKTQPPTRQTHTKPSLHQTRGDSKLPTHGLPKNLG